MYRNIHKQAHDAYRLKAIRGFYFFQEYDRKLQTAEERHECRSLCARQTRTSSIKTEKEAFALTNVHTGETEFVQYGDLGLMLHLLIIARHKRNQRG